MYISFSYERVLIKHVFSSPRKPKVGLNTICAPWSARVRGSFGPTAICADHYAAPSKVSVKCSKRLTGNEFDVFIR